MDSLAIALLNSGTVTEKDVIRVKEQQEKETEEENRAHAMKMEADLVERRATRALQTLPGKMVMEISDFIKAHGAAICPLEVLETIADKVKREPSKNKHRAAQTEWAKWLCVLREAEKI